MTDAFTAAADLLDPPAGEDGSRPLVFELVADDKRAKAVRKILKEVKSNATKEEAPREKVTSSA